MSIQLQYWISNQYYINVLNINIQNIQYSILKVLNVNTVLMLEILNINSIINVLNINTIWILNFDYMKMLNFNAILKTSIQY